MPKDLRIDSDKKRRVDALARPDSLADMLRRRRIAIENGDPEEAQRITLEWTEAEEKRQKK